MAPVLFFFILGSTAGCKTSTGPTGNAIADLSGTWRGYVWTDAGPRYDARVYLYQRSNGDLSGDFSIDSAYCISGGDVTGHVSETSVSMDLASQNGRIWGSGYASVDSSGYASYIEIETAGSGWCGNQGGLLRLWIEKRGW